MSYVEGLGLYCFPLSQLYSVSVFLIVFIFFFPFLAITIFDTSYLGTFLLLFYSK